MVLKIITLDIQGALFKVFIKRKSTKLNKPFQVDISYPKYLRVSLIIQDLLVQPPNLSLHLITSFDLSLELAQYQMNLNLWHTMLNLKEIFKNLIHDESITKILELSLTLLNSTPIPFAIIDSFQYIRNYIPS